MARPRAGQDGHGRHATPRPRVRVGLAGLSRSSGGSQVSRVPCPMTVVQGLDDEYGTMAQVERIRRRAAVDPEVVLLERCGHSPPRDRPSASLEAVKRLVEKVMTSS